MPRKHRLPKSRQPVARLLEIMRILRSPGGCPWDREQNLQSLKKHLIEESYEVLDAIDSGDRTHLAEELGDLLLQVVFQAQICDEEGSFDFEDVVRALSKKLLRRHTHVFGDVKVTGSGAALKNWDAVKQTEKGKKGKSAVEGIPRHLPALHRAQQIQKKVARIGFDWHDVDGVIQKIEEELGEVKAAISSGKSDSIREEIGDLLFAVVNLSRFLGHCAEEALDTTIRKFVRRFQAIEKRLHQQGRAVTECSLEELDRIWNEVKKAERKKR